MLSGKRTGSDYRAVQVHVRASGAGGSVSYSSYFIKSTEKMWLARNGTEHSSPSSPDPNRALSTSTTTPSPASSPPRRPPGFVLTPPPDLPLPHPRSQRSTAPSNVIRERVKLGDAKSRNARVEQPVKVQHRGAGLGQRKSFYDSTDFFSEPTKRSASIFEDIDRRLRIRGIDEPSKDLETTSIQSNIHESISEDLKIGETEEEEEEDQLPYVSFLPSSINLSPRCRRGWI
ncbi:hypothetical protein CRG98_026786 [Punica granatum]|uniref:Uncharacterized protein n=1 Tax=Punica granatum TaxID=22663 RepID=A0A2I0J9D0_PUNGR|nr:hypothetical protein CRG98_026786 [Punica granatum]